MARKAKDTGRSMRLKPLSPQERRIIHVVLQDDDEIRTFSLGNSVHRRIVIVPKGASYDERDDDSDDGADRVGVGGGGDDDVEEGGSQFELEGEEEKKALHTRPCRNNQTNHCCCHSTIQQVPCWQ